MMKLTLLTSICIYTFSVLAQPCDPGYSDRFLYANNIRALFRVGGTMFIDTSSTPGFVVNIKSMDPYVSTIYAGGLWMKAKDKSNNIKYAFELYGKEDEHYLPFGANQSECLNWDKIWLLNKGDIDTHINDWKNDHKIDNKLSSIYSWPGKGNPYFFSYNFFELPDTLKSLAPFYDNNKDQIYNPDDGDYPALFDIKTGKYAIPNQMLWYMFKENNYNGLSSISLNMIIQVTAWEFSGNDKLLNNTVFTKHDFLYEGVDTLYDFKTALFIDLDIGCYSDDYMGTSKELSTIYGYNKDTIDGEPGNKCSGTNTFNDDPGVQAVTFLSDSLYASIFWSNNSVGSDPVFQIEYINAMDAKDAFGIHLKDDKGNNTNYHYYGNPNNPGEWSMKSAQIMNSDLRAIVVAELGDLYPGDVKSLTAAYSYFNNPELKSTPSDLDSMFTGVKRLHELYDGFFEDFKVSTKSVLIDDYIITPNPASNNIVIDSGQFNRFVIDIYDIYGRIQITQRSNTKTTSLDISKLIPGTYIVSLKSNGVTVNRKLFKL